MKTNGDSSFCHNNYVSFNSTLLEDSLVIITSAQDESQTIQITLELTGVVSGFTSKAEQLATSLFCCGAYSQNHKTEPMKEKEGNWVASLI